MIPRYQRILFLVLMMLSVLMAAFLWRVHQRTTARLNSVSLDAPPIEAPSTATAEPITFLVADDSEGSITARDTQLALPAEPTIRLRAILERMFVDYAKPDSHHPLSIVPPAIADVFFLPLPISAPGTPANEASRQDGFLAVINLRQSFADAHPSGIEVETLTVLSVLGTVHANFPQVSKVRFLVDGKMRETLAGHFRLDRTFPSVDTTLQPAKADTSQ